MKHPRRPSFGFFPDRIDFAVVPVDIPKLSPAAAFALNSQRIHPLGVTRDCVRNGLQRTPDRSRESLRAPGPDSTFVWSQSGYHGSTSPRSHSEEICIVGSRKVLPNFEQADRRRTPNLLRSGAGNRVAVRAMYGPCQTIL